MSDILLFQNWSCVVVVVVLVTERRGGRAESIMWFYYPLLSFGLYCSCYCWIVDIELSLEKRNCYSMVRKNSVTITLNIYTWDIIIMAITFKDWIPVGFKCSSSRYCCYMIISDFLRYFLFLRGIKTGNYISWPLGFSYIKLVGGNLMRLCRSRSHCSQVVVEGKWVGFGRW